MGRDVYLNVARAPLFLAPGDPEHSRLYVTIATSSDERDLYYAWHRGSGS